MVFESQLEDIQLFCLSESSNSILIINRLSFCIQIENFLGSNFFNKPVMPFLGNLSIKLDLKVKMDAKFLNDFFTQKMASFSGLEEYLVESIKKAVVFKDLVDFFAFLDELLFCVLPKDIKLNIIGHLIRIYPEKICLLVDELIIEKTSCGVFLVNLCNWQISYAPTEISPSQLFRPQSISLDISMCGVNLFAIKSTFGLESFLKHFLANVIQKSIVSSFKSLEEFSAALVNYLTMESQFCTTLNQLTVKLKNETGIEKESVFSLSKNRSVECCLPQFRNRLKRNNSSNTCYIGIGSNLGDRLTNINLALSLMNDAGFKLEETSFLYEVSPNPHASEEFIGGVLSVSKYLNAVVRCSVSQSMTPLQCLDQLQLIESQLGRKRSNKKSSHSIDLDIIFFNDDVISTERLNVPHPLMHFRSYVMIPLLDLFSSESCFSNTEHIFHPKIGVSLATLYRNSINLNLSFIVDRIVPLSPCKLIKYRSSEVSSGIRSSLLCGIVNVTPDSFSDGGQFFTTENACAHALRLVESGADWIDVGGQTTKPGAVECPIDEEIDRVSRVIKALCEFRSSDSLNFLISIDTYRAEVAEAAISLGANIINDISGGLRDPRIFEVAKRHKCPIIIMHSTEETRGKTDGILEFVKNALASRVSAAIGAEIYRWNIILDPGIGFAKSIIQNTLLINDLLANCENCEILPGYPSLVGYSRKSFIGKIVGNSDPKERIFGDLALGTLFMNKVVFAIRIHDVNEHNQSKKMINFIRNYKQSSVSFL